MIVGMGNERNVMQFPNTLISHIFPPKVRKNINFSFVFIIQRKKSLVNSPWGNLGTLFLTKSKNRKVFPKFTEKKNLCLKKSLL